MKTLVVWFPCRSKLSVRSTSPDLIGSPIYVGHGLCVPRALRNCLQDAKFPDCMFHVFSIWESICSKALRHRASTEKFIDEIEFW